jgi:hypothetical protein
MGVHLTSSIKGLICSTTTRMVKASVGKNLDGTLRGFNEFVLHTYNMSASSPHKTDCRLHQYHIGGRAKDEEELVVSKIFHHSQNNLSELAEKYHAESELVSHYLFHVLYYKHDHRLL